MTGPGTVELRWTGTDAELVDGAGFTVAVTVAPPTPTGRRELSLVVEYHGQVEVEASVRLTVPLPDRTDEPGWLVPGAFYGENRPAECRSVFPRFAVGAADPAGMVSDHWEFRADRAATPAVFGWGGTGGAALVTGETGPLGMTGLGFSHDAASGRAAIHLRFPFREAPVSYRGSARAAPAEAAPCRWWPGRRVRLELALYELDGDRHGYAPVLREAHARESVQAPLRPWVDVARGAELAAAGLYDWRYDPEPGVLLETVGFDRGISGRDGLSVDRQAMHVGWVSGIPWAYALLRHGRRVGRADHAAAAERVIDLICANPAPCGTFWATWYRDRGWSQSWSPLRHSLQSRTLGEASLFLARALQLGPDLPERRPGWVAALRSTLDAVVARQRADGNPGAARHAHTGEVLSWAGCAGLAWVSALAEASRWGEHYLAAAERAGDYYARFVAAEFLNGAPEDVDLAPTSEDGYVAVIAYLALYRRTGAPRWLELARRAADWMLTFRYCYNTAFPTGTLLQVYGFATRGADNASPCNPHLHAYGLICTAELAELSAATGDGYYLVRARETLACFRQFIARFDGDFNAYRGMAGERYYQTACFQPKGMLLTLSHAWSVGALLLGCEQALADPTVADGPTATATATTTATETGSATSPPRW